MVFILILVVTFICACSCTPNELMKKSETDVLKSQVQLLTQEIEQLKKEVSSLDNYCQIISETVCGPCLCRDNNKIPSKYHCDCQNLTPERDCRAFYEKGFKNNGVYKVHQNNLQIIQVFCDQTTDGGGWTVFQRRSDGTVNFYRNWFNYKVGFGDLTNEFWLGNQALFTLSFQALHPSRSELRIELETWAGVKKYAKYADFQIGDEHTNYKLHVSGYSGNAGESLIIEHHNARAFSTFDKDNDGNIGDNCASLFKGGWWYGSCHKANLNGRYYYFKEMGRKATGIHWFPIDKHNTNAFEHVEMKMRRN